MLTDCALVTKNSPSLCVYCKTEYVVSSCFLFLVIFRYGFLAVKFCFTPCKMLLAPNLQSKMCLDKSSFYASMLVPLSPYLTLFYCGTTYANTKFNVLIIFKCIGEWH